MKTLSNITQTTLRLAVSSSLAFIATLSAAHAQAPVVHTETVTLRSGNDLSGQPLSLAGDDDENITFTTSTSTLAAINGPPAKRIVPHSAWAQNISDPDALWIHSTHNPTASDGTGTDEDDILFAHRFELPLNMPADATVDIQMSYAADDTLQGVGIGDSSGVLASLAGFNGGSFNYESTRSISGSAIGLGLSAGENYLFVQQEDTGGQYSGIIYSVTVTVEYCVVETELKSGMRYHPINGWMPFGVGTTMPGVRAITLPEVFTSADLNIAFDDLGQGLGGNAVTVTPNAGWGTLSQQTQWINSHNGSSGDHHRSVLYAIDFMLPMTLAPGSIATLDLEWTADDRLDGVFMNGQSGALSLINSTSMIGPNSYALPTTATTTRSAQNLFLSPGANTLFLLQEDVDNAISGINYDILLTVTVPCESDTAYESFCDCPMVVAPCGNAGAPGQGCENSSGAGSQLTATGLATIGGGSTLQLHASNLPTPQTIGLFFQGNNVLNPTPFGDGLRCVGGSIERIEVVITGTGSADSSVLAGPASSGVKFYQFWYRDAPSQQSPCNSGFNLSNGVAIGWN